MKSYVTCSTALIAKLQALEESAGVPLFDHIYAYHNPKPDGFPCAFVTEKAGQGQILDTARNEREWQFEITLMQDFTGAGRTPAEAAEILRKTVDTVLEAFDQDPQLKDEHGEPQCMKVKVVPVAFDFGLREVPYEFARFIVAVVDMVNNYA